MSTTELELAFEGEAVVSGTMDAGVLGNALTGYSEVFRRANELANGEASQAVVLVEADFRRASFDINLQLVQSLIDNAKALITAHPFLSATELAAAIGLVAWHQKESLISVLKWLKGKRPEKITQTGNNVELVLFGKKKVVSNTINIFLNDAPLRQALARTVVPLREKGIDRLKVRPKSTEPNTEPTTIEKDEANYLQPDALQLAAYEAPDEGHRDATLIITKLSFIEGQKWAFLERGATVVAEIKDDEFWKNVHRGAYSFAEGDRLRARLHWTVVSNKGRPKAENTIIKVHEVLPRAKQMRIDGAKDDEV